MKLKTGLGKKVRFKIHPPVPRMKKPKPKYPLHHLQLAFDSIKVYLTHISEGPALYDLRRILRELNLAIAEIRFENGKK